MATLFQLPKTVPVSGGNSYSGAKAYFYQSGTTTPITTYTTAALSVPHANPVVADANGVFAPIFIDEGTNATYKLRLNTSTDVLIYEVDSIPTTLNQASLGAAIWPRSDTERDNNVTIARYYYPWGNLKRYTSNDGDGTDISLAFESMLNCGEKYCFVPAPTSTWGIGTQIDWVSGVSVHCGLGTSFTSSRASGEWTFVFDGVPYGSGAAFEGFILNITNAGARGVQLWESRNVRINNFEIRGPSGIGGYGLEINGGDDASGTYGSAHNSVSNGMVYRMAAGIRLYTDNTTTPADTTAFANRNYVWNVHANSCTEGLSIDRANTNEIHMSLQANTEGADIGQYAKNNHFHLYPESNTRQIVINTSAQNNVFSGSVAATYFVDSGGSAADPRLDSACLGGELYLLPRDVTLPNGGGIRLLNPFDAGPARLRIGDTYDQDFILGSHDAADTNFDLFALRYDATAPYCELVASRTMRLGAASRIRWNSADSQTTVGAAGGASGLPATPTGYVTINVNGTDYVVPYYPVS